MHRIRSNSLTFVTGYNTTSESAQGQMPPSCHSKGPLCVHSDSLDELGVFVINQQRQQVYLTVSMEAGCSEEDHSHEFLTYFQILTRLKSAVASVT